jgi:hypothetical protein
VLDELKYKEDEAAVLAAAGEFPRGAIG